MPESLQVDLLVVGAGMAGLTAASAAACAGLRVLVVEKNPDIGGSALLSGGKLWTGKTFELLDHETPGGDVALKRVAFGLHERAASWIRQSGVHINAHKTPHLHYGSGYDFDVIGYLRWCAAAVIDAGGHVVRSATIDQLTLADGAVVGAVVGDRDGATDVRAPYALLSSGGFSGAPKLLECFVAAQGAKALARSNPTNTGDG